MIRSAGRVASRAIAAVVAGASLAGSAAAVAHGAPGVPDPPVVLFREDFENGTGQSIVNLDSYNSATESQAGGGSPAQYRAGLPWDASNLTCNGLIVSFAGSTPECSTSGGGAKIKALARAAGMVGADATPDDNHAVGEGTDPHPDPPGPGPEDNVELRFSEGAALAGSTGQYLVVGIDVAAINCGLSAPQLSFFLSEFGTPLVALSPEPQNVCAEGQPLGDVVLDSISYPAVGGHVYSDGSTRATIETMDLEVHNANLGSSGNDHALDNLVVADATPQLDQGFSPATTQPGSPVDLAFTVTNTSDLAAKADWSFTGTLPAGLTVSDAALPRSLRAATTCPSSTVTAAAGGGSIAASGSLSAGQVSCTVTVGVRPASAGTFGAATVTTNGLRLPGTATLTVAAPAAAPPAATPAACADGADNDGDGLADANDPGCVLNGVYTPQKDSEANIAPTAQCAAGALVLTDVFGRSGRTVVRGVAGPDAVGQKVGIFSMHDAKQVATAMVQGDLSFATTAALPPLAIRGTNAARFQARLGTDSSRALKFARRMTETVASRTSATRVRIGGRVTKPFALPRARIVVRGAQNCQRDERFRGVVVARNVRVLSNGRWTATVTLPASLRGDMVFLRAQTSVRKTSRSRRTFATYTLIQGVALK